MAGPIEIWKGQLSPSISDVVEVDDSPFDTTGCSAKLRMRLKDSSTLKVDAAATLLQTGTAPNIVNQGAIRWDPAGTDTDTPGEYRAWWHLTLPSGKTQDTPEFIVLILDHAPASTVNLATLDEFKLHTQIEGDERDDAIMALIQSASVKIMDEVGREICPRDDGPTTRRFRVDPRRAVRNAILVSLSSPRSDLRSVVQMRLHPETSSPVTVAAGAGGYTLDPQASQFGVYTAVRLSRKLSYGSDTLADFGYCYLDISGAWGFAAIPEQAMRACILTVDSWLNRGVNMYAESPTDPASIMPASAKSYAIPGDAKAMLGKLYRARIF